MTSSIFKKHDELIRNSKKLTKSTQKFLQTNYKIIQSSPSFPNRLPKMLRLAIQEAKKTQKLSKLTQEAFFEKYSERYEKDTGSQIASNYSSYFSKGKRPKPIRLKRLLNYMNEESGHLLYFSPEEREVLDSIPSHIHYNSDTQEYQFTHPPLTDRQKAIEEKEWKSSLMSLQSTSEYFYAKTIFFDSDDLFSYINKVLLQSIHAMLLLNQQMNLLKWDQLEDPHIAIYKSNSNFLEANSNTNEIVYLKAKLISNINLVENEMFCRKNNFNIHHSYYDVLQDPCVQEDKVDYSSIELQALFQEYYPCVYSLFKYWKEDIPNEIYSIFVRNLDDSFYSLCNELEFQHRQILERDFIFSSIADTLYHCLYSHNNIVKHWIPSDFEKRSKFFF